MALETKEVNRASASTDSNILPSRPFKAKYTNVIMLEKYSRRVII